ncbi:unnamed protein product [Oikopleura dioica]|uniref:Gypsy retrotransposon integrase-like protein 1 n=1 Tax=Oikopleura dioica TaxID=34765 RepID=E4X2A5_OIKDI|nr:unnamed protein product [Oikopleura dioica]
MPEAFVQISNKLVRSKGKCFLTALDWFRGYWALQVDEQDSKKLAFSVNNRHYAATRMLYGTSTGPAAFSLVMSELFSDHPSIFIYLDDCLVIDITFEEHMKTLEFIFKTCLEYGILMSSKKVKFCRAEFDFLGHKINSSGISATNKHIQAIKDSPTPKDRKSLKQFLGLANFNIKFVKNGSQIMSPLYKLTSQKIPFEWTEVHQSAFEEIVTQLATSPGIAHFDKEKPVTFVTDASDHAVGGTLYQADEDDLVPFGYFFHELTGPDFRRSMRQKELLTVAYAVKSFEYYLIGAEFDLVVEHKSLIYLIKEKRRKELDCIITNIYHYLLKFNFNILHRPGDSPILASSDCLSRLPRKTQKELEDECEYEEIPNKVFSMMHMPSYFKETTSQNIRDLIYGCIGTKEKVENSKTDVFRFGSKTFSTELFREIQTRCGRTNNIMRKLEMKANRVSKFINVHGILYKKGRQGRRLVIPEALDAEFLSYLHSSMGHPGYHQMVPMIKDMYIHRAGTKLREFVTRCEICIRTKPHKMIRPGAVKNKYFESVPFSKTHIDLIDFSRKDFEGNRYFLSFVDSFTGYCDGIAISNKTDGFVAKSLLTLIFRNKERIKVSTRISWTCCALSSPAIQYPTLHYFCLLLKKQCSSRKNAPGD